MEVVVQGILQILLPAFLLTDMFRRRHRSRLEWLLDLVMITLVLAFAFITARWDWFSYYLRILLLPALGLVAYASFRCIDTSPDAEEAEQADSQKRRPVKRYIEYGIKGLVIGLALVFNGQALLGCISPPDALRLSYPLRNGVYYVGGGGASRWINGHHTAGAQAYALDIVRLNVTGGRAYGFWPDSLDRYAIYGNTVYSPCDGTVVQRVDGHPDLTPPNRDPEHLAGNHIVLRCGDASVVLAHLQEGSISVAIDEDVFAGQALALVGNSGNTTQPHLHIHAERYEGNETDILQGEGIPILFDNRFLVRNGLFTGR